MESGVRLVDTAVGFLDFGVGIDKEAAGRGGRYGVGAGGDR